MNTREKPGALFQRRRQRKGETELIEAMRSGDEAAFRALVAQYQSSLLRLARIYVPSQAVAEEVVQETWLGIFKGVGRFERRSSLKTWIFSILVNVAKTRGLRESRSIPFSSAMVAEVGSEGAAVDPDRFFGPDHDRLDNWALGPTSWGTPEESLLSGETRKLILETIERLPAAQREVITLRDVEGWSAEEARNALNISETNQRVLLHRARSRVRGALERYFDATEPTA